MERCYPLSLAPIGSLSGRPPAHSLLIIKYPPSLIGLDSIVPLTWMIKDRICPNQFLRRIIMQNPWHTRGHLSVAALCVCVAYKLQHLTRQNHQESTFHPWPTAYSMMQPGGSSQQNWQGPGQQGAVTRSCEFVERFNKYPDFGQLQRSSQPLSSIGLIGFNCVLFIAACYVPKDCGLVKIIFARILKYN